MHISERGLEVTRVNPQILDDTIAYLRRELTGIHQDLTWADGARAEALRVRQARLVAELERLESMRRAMPLTPMLHMRASAASR